MLDEAQGKYIDNDKIRQYTASVRCEKDVSSLSKIGLNIEEVSRSLEVPVSFVKRQMARIAQSNEAKDRFLRTGVIPASDPGVFTIFQR